jgi:hypothetical protein
MEMKPCKHLDYDGNYHDCEIKTCSPHFPDVKYWHRNNAAEHGNPVKVQFCKKRGRINGVFDCYNIGEMHCHEADA